MNVFLFLYSDAESGETKVELNKVSTSIPFYGVPDLAEVLGKLRFSDYSFLLLLLLLRFGCCPCFGFAIETCYAKNFVRNFAASVFIVHNFCFVIELACQKDSSDSNSLSSCRPFKVIHYLQVFYFVRSVSFVINTSHYQRVFV